MKGESFELDSPSSNRSSTAFGGDAGDGNLTGLRRRSRNFSGNSPLDILPFPADFSKPELVAYFEYFLTNKIR